MRERQTKEATEEKEGRIRRGVARSGPGPAGHRHELLHLQGTVGNANVVQRLQRSGHAPHAEDHGHGHDHPHGLPVQRAITVDGTAVEDPAQVLAASDVGDLLSETGLRVLNYLKRPEFGASLDVKDGEELAIEVDRIAAMIDLVHSINSSGILGRRTLGQQGIAHTGSNDLGDTTALAVNVLDARTATDHEALQDVVTNSLTSRNNGSFSVAMERPQDEDMILADLAEVTDGGGLSETELEGLRRDAAGDASLLGMLVNAMRNQKLSEAQGEVVARYTALLQARTENTAMAIIDRPGADVATLGPGSRAYESDVPADRIPPGGAGGFTSLVLPGWFEPYGLLLMTRDWPAGVKLRFAGTKKITAHYRAADQDWPVTVDAPDYASEIEKTLQEFKLIATHILKTSGGI
ncbi:hypothetical protein ACIPPS_21140 [Streptomyces sp. NPDC090127]|uniref:hypothetical protein n=1 Tax=Streptomyces sp. NPDC090127 TaxID=3365953 RepID=UPI003807C0A2